MDFRSQTFGRYILGPHFGYRPLDPTLDIWSNFVKKEKKNFTSFFFLFQNLQSNSVSRLVVK